MFCSNHPTGLWQVSRSAGDQTFAFHGYEYLASIFLKKNIAKTQIILVFFSKYCPKMKPTWIDWV
jgi:hypothetical protein